MNAYSITRSWKSIGPPCLSLSGLSRRCRFFDIARGSALESAAALDVLVAKGRCSGEELLPGKDRLWSIVSMLVALIKANSDYRLHDGSPE